MERREIGKRMLETVMAIVEKGKESGDTEKKTL